MAGPIIVTPGQTVAPPDWNALLLQHGNLTSSVPVPITDPKVQAMLVANPSLAETLQQHPIYRYYMADGSFVEAQGQENGQDVQIVDYQPSQRFQQAHPVAGTAAGGTNTFIGTNPVSGRPSQVTTYSDGRPPTYDDTQVPASQVNQGETTSVEGTQLPDGTWDNSQPREVVRRPDGKGGTVLVSSKPLTGDARLQWEKQKNGGKTDAELAQFQQTATDEQPVNGRPGWVQITTKTGNTSATKFRGPDGQTVDTLPAVPGAPTLKPDGKGGTIAVQTMPDGTIKTTPLPGVPSDRPLPQNVTVGGQVYERDPQTGTYAPAKGLPTEGAATAGGPPMPNFVRDGSIAALTTYHQALWNDPTLTPETREKRFQEAVQVANAANTQYATDQRDRESQRSADYNAASTRLQFMQNSTTNALDFVSKLNAQLPEGSDLGGKAFAALLGLQTLQLQRSGINSPPSLQAPLPVITTADLSNHQALDAHNAQIAQQTAAAAATPPAPAVPPAAVSAPAVPAVAPGARPAAAPAPAPAATSAPLAPNRPDQTQVGSQIDNAIMPPAAPPPTGIGPTAPVGGSVLPQPAGAPAPTNLAPYQDDQRQPAAPPPATPADMQPGARIQVPGEAPGVSVPYPSEAGAESKVNAYPALLGLGSPMTPLAPPPPPSGGSDPGDMAFAAAKRAQIASVPPWRLSPEDLAWAQQNGFMNEAMQIPGAAA